MRIVGFPNNIWSDNMENDKKFMTRGSLLRKAAGLAVLAPAALLAACAQQPEAQPATTPPPPQPQPQPTRVPRARG